MKYEFKSCQASVIHQIGNIMYNIKLKGSDVYKNKFSLYKIY